MRSLGLLELGGLSAALVALDVMEKAAEISLLQVELNDLYGVCLKICGETAAVTAATRAGEALAKQMHVAAVATVIPAPDPASRNAYDAPPEYSPLIEQQVVYHPNASERKGPVMSEQAPFAIGMIETQGLVAVIEAIDTACKAANVEVLGREKLGGGYITVIVKGDVAAVKAAIEAGKAKLKQQELGKLIAAHVIPRPSSMVLALLPQESKSARTA